MSSSPRGATASKLVSRASRSRAMPPNWHTRGRCTVRSATLSGGRATRRRAARSGSSRSGCDSGPAERGAIVAGEDARAVDEDPPPPQPGEERLVVPEADERRVVLDPDGAHVGGLAVVDLAVELEARAAVPRLDVEA